MVVRARNEHSQHVYFPLFKKCKLNSGKQQTRRKKAIGKMRMGNTGAQRSSYIPEASIVSLGQMCVQEFLKWRESMRVSYNQCCVSYLREDDDVQFVFISMLLIFVLSHHLYINGLYETPILRRDALHRQKQQQQPPLYHANTPHFCVAANEMKITTTYDVSHTSFHSDIYQGSRKGYFCSSF